MKDLCIFDIQRFAIHDGPGIRTTVFTKGCPLDCQWCHNPESKSFLPQLRYLSKNCTGCGRCRDVCPANAHHIDQNGHTVDFQLCNLCGSCVKACCFGALKIYGETKTTNEILDVVERDRAFYDKSGGGVTVSGGEPMVQLNPLLELLENAKKRRFHTCLDTCGFAPTKSYSKIRQFVDLFLFDYKITDPDKHLQYTGVRNDLILDNLDFLCSNGGTVFLRCPIIPDINDDDEHLRAIAALSCKYDAIKQVNIMAYHDMGRGKAKQIGSSYSLDETADMNNEAKQQLYLRLEDFGCTKLENS